MTNISKKEKQEWYNLINWQDLTFTLISISFFLEDTAVGNSKNRFQTRKKKDISNLFLLFFHNH